MISKLKKDKNRGYSYNCFIILSENAGLSLCLQVNRVINKNLSIQYNIIRANSVNSRPIGIKGAIAALINTTLFTFTYRKDISIGWFSKLELA